MLISCVEGAQRAGTLLGVLVKSHRERLAFWLCRLSEDGPIKADGTIQSLREWVRESKGRQMCSGPGHSCFPALGHWRSWGSDSDWDLPLQPLDSQALRLGVNHTTSSPSFSAWRWEIMGLPSLHNWRERRGDKFLDKSPHIFFYCLLIPFLWKTLKGGVCFKIKAFS